ACAVWACATCWACAESAPTIVRNDADPISVANLDAVGLILSPLCRKALFRVVASSQNRRVLSAALGGFRIPSNPPHNATRSTAHAWLSNGRFYALTNKTSYLPSTGTPRSPERGSRQI